jgi:hypothetical protein
MNVKNIDRENASKTFHEIGVKLFPNSVDPQSDLFVRLSEALSGLHEFGCYADTYSIYTMEQIRCKFKGDPFQEQIEKFLFEVMRIVVSTNRFWEDYGDMWSLFDKLEPRE